MTFYRLRNSVEGLPARLSSRSLAATWVERLNYDEGSFDGETMKWNSIQFLPKHYRALSDYLVGIIRRQRRQAALAPTTVSV